MDLQLSGKRALVTGGSRGIGLACARKLAWEGCRVMLAARDPAALEAGACAMAEETGAEAAIAVVDTSSDASVKAMVRAAVEALTAEEVADVVALLASRRSVCINGDAIACGGGSRGSIHS